MKKSLIVAVLLCASPVLTAATFDCSGVVEKVAAHMNKGVYVKGPWNIEKQRICNLDGTWNSIPAETCKYWASALQTAMYTGKRVLISYTNVTPASCAALPDNSSAPAPSQITIYPN
jgi:hypothetical protein